MRKAVENLFFSVSASLRDSMMHHALTIALDMEYYPAAHLLQRIIG
jgi:hypothetical protein